MNGFFRELQERGVIRVAGLYGAVVWLLLQASDVLFPAFNIPDSAVKILLAGSLVCLPVVLGLAWFYEITDKGIQLEEDVRKTGARRLMTGNEIYFVIIALLAIALSISVYLNFQASDITVADEPELISVLIADFDNQTNDPIFDGSVEEALTIGVEGASFISSYNRSKALKIAEKLNSGTQLLEARARLVAVREGIDLVLSGSISLDEDGFLLSLKAIDPKKGELVAEAEATAEGKLEVLQAVGSLAGQLREEFGDVSLSNNSLSASETFSAASLAAMQLYSRAQTQAQVGNLEEAAKLYEQATIEDSEFGRAYSGWALSEFKLGHNEIAENLWTKTLTLLNGMTAREKYRTLGLYYTRVTHNYSKAIENYQQLVDQYPADAVGRNNLAVSYFMVRQFAEALQEGKAMVDIYPDETVFRSNYALYAMYAGDFVTAKAEAEKLIASDKTFYKAYLPLSMASLLENNLEAAKQTYQQMATVDVRGASLAATGLADIALTEGNFAQAIETLRSGIADDLFSGNTRFLAAKYILLAQAYIGSKSHPEARESLAEALNISRQTAQLVPAALMYLKLEDTASAEELAVKLGQHLQPEDRAYAALIQGNLALARNDSVQAVDEFKSALNRTDMWLIRLNLGKAYVSAGYHAEALSEFEICQGRMGEVTALFLDDMPTFHHSVELFYWLGRAQHELGITGASAKNLETFLSHQSAGEDGDLVIDAQSRLGTLTSSASSK